MAGTIGINEELFDKLEGEELLQRIRRRDLNGTKGKLKEVLKRIPTEYGKEEEKRELRRTKRIELYKNLLLIALGAEGEDWNSWYYDGSAAQLWVAKSASNLADSGSIYKYLLDHIYEDEEIMFFYFHSRKLLHEQAVWLVESLELYRMHLVNPILEMLKPRDEENKVASDELLEKAKQAFKEKLWSCQRSWRGRARMYWLLARAKHAPISKGKVGKFKSFSYSGPISTLVEEMINEDTDMLLEKDGESISHYVKLKYDKNDKDKLQLGTLRICSLLAWASAADFHDLVRCILQHREQYIKSDECDWEWEKAWAKSWAQALWNAAYKGHDKIVQELMNCAFPDQSAQQQANQLCSFELFAAESMQPPLHVAVRRGFISVVEVFCKPRSNFSCHEEDHILKQTPLEAATSHTDVSIKRKIQSILLQRPEVNRAVDESYRQRELTVGSANAIMVGAALIAGVTFGGWLQPPLGFNSYYQFPEPLPAPPDTYESYLSIQGHRSIRVFAIFNSLSFFCAIAAIVAGMETTCFIEDLEETYIATTVKHLKSKLRRTTTLFIVSVIFVLGAFASAAIAILPPIHRYQWDMYITVILGGLVCLVFIGRMLLFCASKSLYKKTTSWFERMTEQMVKKFCTNFSTGACCKVPPVSLGASTEQHTESMVGV